MYNDDELNRPLFDANTGEPIQYDEAGEVAADQALNCGNTPQEGNAAPGNEEPASEYRYSRNEIPFNEESAAGCEPPFEAGAQSGPYCQNSGVYGSGPQYGNTGYGAPYGSMNYGQAAYQSNMGMGTPAKAKKQKKKKEKSGSGFGRKVAALLISAAVFGMVAGSVMYGVYYAGGKLFPNSNSLDYNIPTVTSNIPTTLTGSNGETDGLGSMDVSAVARAALPAMVALEGTTTVSSSGYYGAFGGQNYEASTSGTGIIVGKNDTELLILTNAHVVDSVNGLKCVFVDGEAVSATVKGSKSDKDIAVVAVNLSDIKSDTISRISIAELGDSEDVAVGQQVVAIGNALGEGQSVTNGIISALNRSITVNNVTFEGLFMTNAAINSGNSGGALLNADGRVIGINFAKTSENGVEGMAYSIPVSNVKELIDSLMNRQTRQTKVNDSQASYLGISGVDITSAMAQSYGYPQGVYIRTVSAGSAAEKAGLGAYDIIVGFDNQTVSTFTGLQSLMQYYAAGETVTIEYYHIEGSEYVLKSVEVTLDQKNK